MRIYKDFNVFNNPVIDSWSSAEKILLGKRIGSSPINVLKRSSCYNWCSIYVKDSLFLSLSIISNQYSFASNC